MMRIPGEIICLALFLLLSGCSQPTPVDTRADDERAIRDLDAQWSKTAGANDLDGTVSYYTDDAILLPPNAPIATDKQSIRASWASLLSPGVSVSWQINKIEVSRSGDLAYVAGVYALTMKDPRGNPVSDRGKLIEVWKKQSDGKWKAAADTYNSDLPAPAPPQKK